MAGLQRSEISFRRQGSSGLVWEDRLPPGELKKKEEGGASSEFREPRQGKSVEGGIERGYRTGKVTPSLDPPSPKVSGCGFCGVFGKPGDHPSKTKAAAAATKAKTGKHKSQL